MQGHRRTNAERSRGTRGALVGAARALFVDRGYTATSTPQVAAAAQVSRGALYHHFADKRDLFRAVLEAEARAVAAEIEAAAQAAAGGHPRAPAGAPGELVAGADAYLSAMAAPGRTRLLLVEGPAVLGVDESAALDAEHPRRTLREGLAAADPQAARDVLDVRTAVLSAALDEAALRQAAGADPAVVRRVVRELLGAVVGGAA